MRHAWWLMTLVLAASPTFAAAQNEGAAAPVEVEATETPAEPVLEAPSSEVPVPEAPSPEEAEPVEDSHDWIDDLSLAVFVDAYAAEHWTLPNGFAGDHQTQLPQRVYDTNGGPSVSLIGVSASYAPQPIGATLSLRFGTGENRWLGTLSGLPQGLQFLHQAFVSWRPIDQLQIDFGEFTTPFGGEVGETWLNCTYTLGSLFQLVQPFYHAGFRAEWQPYAWLTLTAIAVNGYNDIVDNNEGKSGGLQLTMSFSPVVVSVGYMTGPEQAAVAGVNGVDGRMRHLVDAIVTLDMDPVRLVLNADYRTEDMGGNWTTLFGPMQTSAPGTPQYQTLWGVSLAGTVRLVDALRLGARVEYVGQPDIEIRNGRDLVTGTFTIDVRPIEHLVIRLDNRIDWLSAPLFADVTTTGAMQFVASTILGIVVHSN